MSATLSTQEKRRAMILISKGASPNEIPTTMEF